MERYDHHWSAEEMAVRMGCAVVFTAITLFLLALCGVVGAGFAIWKYAF